MRTIRLSDALFAKRLIGKYGWSIGQSSNRRGMLIYRTEPKARSFSSAPLHIDVHIRNIRSLLHMHNLTISKQSNRERLVQKTSHFERRTLRETSERVITQPAVEAKVVQPARKISSSNVTIVQGQQINQTEQHSSNQKQQLNVISLLNQYPVQQDNTVRSYVYNTINQANHWIRNQSWWRSITAQHLISREHISNKSLPRATYTFVQSTNSHMYRVHTNTNANDNTNTNVNETFIVVNRRQQSPEQRVLRNSLITQYLKQVVQNSAIPSSHERNSQTSRQAGAPLQPVRSEHSNPRYYTIQQVVHNETRSSTILASNRITSSNQNVIIQQGARIVRQGDNIMEQMTEAAQKNIHLQRHQHNEARSTLLHNSVVQAELTNRIMQNIRFTQHKVNSINLNQNTTISNLSNHQHRRLRVNITKLGNIVNHRNELQINSYGQHNVSQQPIMNLPQARSRAAEVRVSQRDVEQERSLLAERVRQQEAAQQIVEKHDAPGQVAQQQVIRVNVTQQNTARQHLIRRSMIEHNVNLRRSMRQHMTLENVTHLNAVRRNATVQNTTTQSVSQQQEQVIRVKVTQQNTARQHLIRQSMIEHNVNLRRSLPEHMTLENVTHLNAVRRNVTEQNVTRQIVTQLHVIRRNKTQRSDTQQQVIHRNTVQQNVTQQQVIHRNKVQHNVTQQQVTRRNETQQNVTEQNVTQQHLTQEKVTLQHATLHNVTRQNMTRNNVTRQNMTRNNVTRQNMTRNNVTQQHINDRHVISRSHQRSLVLMNRINKQQLMTLMSHQPAATKHSVDLLLDGQTVSRAAGSTVPLILSAKKTGQSARQSAVVSREPAPRQAIRLDVPMKKVVEKQTEEPIIRSLQHAIKTVENELNQAKESWAKPNLDMNRLADQMFKEFSKRIRHEQQRRGM